MRRGAFNLAIVRLPGKWSQVTVYQWFCNGFFASLLLLVVSCGSKLPNKNLQRSSPATVLNLPPGDNNPRNSEGDFIQLNDGRILFIYTHFYGQSPSDFGSAFLASRESKDQGKTWSDQDKTEIPNDGQLKIGSVSLLRLQSGQIALFYAKKNSDSDCIPMMRLSDDEAKTWGEAHRCIMDEGYYVLNNDRVIQLPNGRLLMPVALHNIPGGKWTGKGKIYCYYSDDQGVTWQRGDAVPFPEEITAQEPGLVLLRDHSILMFIRTDAGVHCFSKSYDQGLSWSQAEKSQLISPLSPASIERIPVVGDLLAVWNHNVSTNPQIAKQRTPLTLAISKDDGVSWHHIKILEDDPDGRYCYTAMEFTEDAVLLGYASGSQAAKSHWGLNKVIKVDLSWIYQ